MERYSPSEDPKVAPSSIYIEPTNEDSKGSPNKILINITSVNTR